jgi:hypothetical protein
MRDRWRRQQWEGKHSERSSDHDKDNDKDDEDEDE